MRSSREHNSPEKIFRKLNIRSVSWGMLTFCMGLLLVGAFGMGSGESFVSVALLIASVLAGVQAYKFSDHLYGGQFTGHNREILEAKIKRWQGLSIGAFRFENLPFSEFHERQEEVQKMKLTPGYDPDSLYRVSGSRASEVFGYDLRSYRSDDNPEPRLYPTGYQALYQRILRALPAGSMMQVVVRASDYESSFIQAHRQALVEKGIKDVNVYILIGLNSSAHSPMQKRKIESIMHGFRRMSRKEIAAHNEGAVLPKVRGSGLSLPFYAATALSDGDYVQTSVADNVTGAVALGRLPGSVNEFFWDYLEPIRHLNGTIVVRFFMSDTVSAGNLLKVMRQHNKEKDGTASAAEVSVGRSEEAADAEGDLMAAHMDIYALLHGPKGKVDEALGLLHSPKLKQEISDSERARIVQILGHIKDAHGAIMAGSYHYLRERLQKVIRYSEASLYLPRPLTPAGRGSERTLAFRNEDHSVEFIDLSFSDKSFFNAVVGPSGQGKSALVSGMIRAHELRETVQGIKTATIIIDIGSSQRWRTESLGPADIIFDLAKDAANNWVPLPMHPLEALMFEGGESDNDRKHGRDYICQLFGIDTEDVSAASSVEVISESVKELIAMGYPYSMSRLHACMGRASARASEKFSGGEREKFISVWNNYLAFIKRFTREGEFGRVFEPETVTRHDLKGITLFYANVEAQEKDPRDLNAAFLTLCHNLAFAIANRYGPYSRVERSDNKRSILWIVDEYNWQKDFVSETKTTDMADQCRKFGIITMILVQDFSYLILPSSDDDKKFALFKSLAKIFFYDDGGKDNRKIVNVIGKSDEGGLAITRIAERVRDRYSEFGEYSIGYIDEHRQLKRLLVDWEDDFLWEITTHAGGMKLRNFAASELALTRREAARLLALYGPRRIPKADMPLDKMKAVIVSIRKEERFHG